MQLAREANITRAVRDLEVNPAVVYAEPDYQAQLITTPNDPLLPGQWGLAQIDAPAAWDTSTGSGDVVIAVIDLGIETNHPDLDGQFWVNPGEIPGNSLDDDNNGHTDDIHGWNFVEDNDDLSDNTGHGTQVAGVIAAATNNGEGIAGLCWDCRLMIVKVSQPGGVANYSDIAAGVWYASQKGADVINLSLGGYSDLATLRSAVQAASETSVLVGGSGNDNSSAPFYPAAYGDYVLAVAGTSNSDFKVGSSNYGTWVDISAPGELISTTFSGGGYGTTSGTSMAAPFGSGLAGLLRSHHPAWTVDELQAQIINTTEGIDGLNPGLEGELGSGRINANDSLTTPAQPLFSIQTYTIDGITNGKPEPGSTVELDLSLLNDWLNAQSVQATLTSTDPYVSIVSGTTSFGDIATYEIGDNITPLSFSVSGSAPYSHNIPFVINLSANGGYSTNLALTITTSPGITYVHGTISTQTWTNDRLYIVDNNAGVGAGQTLTIEPGTTVRFAGNYSFMIAGTLIADGTALQPILFSSNQPVPAAGNWGLIRFLDTSVDAAYNSGGEYSGGSILRFATVEYGQGVYLDYAAPFIAQNTLRTISGDGIYGNGSPGLTVSGNTLTDAGMNISVGGGDFSVTGNRIEGASLSALGSGKITGNIIGNSPGTGITAQQALTVTANTVIGSAEGLSVNGGFVSGNLLANNLGNGLYIAEGAPTVISNTITFNGGAGVYIAGGTPELSHNNLVAGEGHYAVENATANAVSATGNWWGTTNAMEIEEAIYDGGDDFLLGLVDHGGSLANPDPTAPAYVESIIISPDTTVGIQTATFDVKFSRSMDQSSLPDGIFKRWENYGTGDTILGGYQVQDIAIHPNGDAWIGTNSGGIFRFNGTTWTTYNPFNSTFPDWRVSVIEIAADGSVWTSTGEFGLNATSVAHFNGTTWEEIVPSNEGLPSPQVMDIEATSDGKVWFATLDQARLCSTGAPGRFITQGIQACRRTT